MGSRKRRRERDSSRRHKRSHSRSSSGSHSRSRSKSPIAPPPPSISSKSKEKSEREDRHRHRHKEAKRKHHHRDRSRSRSPNRSRKSKPEPEVHSDSKLNIFCFFGVSFVNSFKSNVPFSFFFVGSDCVEVPLPPPAPVISKTTKSPSPIPENGAGDSLSIEETNKLRAKLGLKPLQSDDGGTTSKKKTGADGEPLHKDEWGEFYHKPANNIAEKLQAEKLREKFRQRKEKRALEQKLKTVKTLGESDEDDDISKWVDASREKEKLKAEAARRAKILEEMDDEFGVSDLVHEETERERKKIYSENNLKGLKVDHDLDAFTEGKSVILTLKDQDVLDEENGDTLINVNFIDDERYRKNIENKKLNPNSYGYNVYDEQVDEFGNPVVRDVLSKYDEDIDGNSKKKKTFTIGQNVEEEIAQKRRLQEVNSNVLNDTQISFASIKSHLFIMFCLFHIR